MSRIKYYNKDTGKWEYADQSQGSSSSPNVNPVAKTDDMTQPVGVDENGQLWTAPTSDESKTIFLSGWQPGYVVSDGSYSEGGTGYTSDYVQVTQGYTYTIVYPSTIEGVRFAIYDSDKNFLSRIVDGTAVYTATADGYIRVTTENADGYTNVYLTVEKATNAGDSCECANYAFLKGLKYFATGDSIVDMQGTLTAPETFGDTGYSKDLQNRDISNITVEGYVTAIERRYGLVATNYGKGGHTLVGDYSTLASMDYSDVALVTIAYGVNDARTSVPLGTVNSTDVTTFAGAMNQLLRKIYTDNPECRVVILTPIQRLYVSDFGIGTANSNGNYLVDFVDMCKKVAAKRSTKCIDMYRDCGINQTNLYYYTVEGVHPVNQGFARMKGAIIPVLDDLFAVEFEPFGTMNNAGDTEPEEPDTGGDTGGEEPPEEDTGVSAIDLTDKLTMDGYYYTYSSTTGLGKMGAGAYKGNAEGIITESGKTYTLVTYLKNDGVWIGCFAASANPTECTNWCDGFNAGKRGSKEEVTINGTVYVKWTYSFAGSNNYLYVGCVTELVDKVSLTYI